MVLPSTAGLTNIGLGDGTVHSLITGWLAEGGISNYLI